MKLLVVGGGGREHAIIKSLKKNPEITEIFALPGNGGIASDATCVAIGATDIEKIVAFAVENAIDYAVVAPDDPLVLGCVDALEEKGIYVSSGSACASNHPAISSTLKTIGVERDLLSATLRFSFSIFTSKEELEYTLNAIKELLPVLRRYRPR